VVHPFRVVLLSGAIASFSSVGGYVGGSAIAQSPPATLLAQTLPANRQDVFFRTRRYVVQVYWKGDVPYMTVSNNGFRVIANQRAQQLSSRGPRDPWTTYATNSGNYQAYVRVAANGQAMIEVTLDRVAIAKEYALTPTAAKNPDLAGSSSQQRATLMAFQTDEYAVNVYQQQGQTYLNLYNRKSKKTEFNQVPVQRRTTAETTIYQYDGDSTIQARETVRGQRSLYILRDNQIQYRGDGY
jgi:hypothetical protein